MSPLSFSCRASSAIKATGKRQRLNATGLSPSCPLPRTNKLSSFPWCHTGLQTNHHDCARLPTPYTRSSHAAASACRLPPCFCLKWCSLSHLHLPHPPRDTHREDVPQDVVLFWQALRPVVQYCGTLARPPSPCSRRRRCCCCYACVKGSGGGGGGGACLEQAGDGCRHRQPLQLLLQPQLHGTGWRQSSCNCPCFCPPCFCVRRSCSRCCCCCCPPAAMRPSAGALLLLLLLLLLMRRADCRCRHRRQC